MISLPTRRLVLISTFVWLVVGIAIILINGPIRSIDAFAHPTQQQQSPLSSSYPLALESPLMVRRYTTGSKRTTHLSSSWLSTRTLKTPLTSTSSSFSTTSTMSQNIVNLRGGSSDDILDDDNNNNESNDLTEALLINEDAVSPTLQRQESMSPVQHFSTTPTSSLSSVILFPTIMINALRQMSSQYTLYLQQYPIRTKSVTACFIFAMSDLLAQVLTKSNDDTSTKDTSIVWTRVLSSAAVGLFYFGPAAHYWYNWIFRILPSTSLFSTLQKAILGQLFFGPSFTCIFFAMSLIQSRTFTIQHWIQKIRNDLPSAWIAGAGYWPIVDLISYSYVPPQFIPLFVNICSFFWTTYLVVKSYK